MRGPCSSRRAPRPCAHSAHRRRGATPRLVPRPGGFFLAKTSNRSSTNRFEITNNFTVKIARLRCSSQATVRFTVIWSTFFSVFQTFRGSLTAVSTPIFASKGAFFSVFRVLHFFLCTIPEFCDFSRPLHHVFSQKRNKSRPKYRESDSSQDGRNEKEIRCRRVGPLPARGPTPRACGFAGRPVQI